MNSLRFVAVVLLVAMLSATDEARAGDAGSNVDETRKLAEMLIVPVFDMLDCTDQGFIESGEVDEHFPLLFNHYDRNLDSSLSAEEFAGRADDADTAELKRRMFADMDRNDNGRVSPREYRDGIIALIRAFDSNSDGEVTMAELVGRDAADDDDGEPEEAE
jgi:Ca2+-binding EF-hand superfamily protein